MSSKKRNFGLDIIRAISILLVLYAHRFYHKYEIGMVGVQIFFILSGFLIGQILINNFYTNATTSTILKFWKRRWFRTLPLYYLVLAFKIFFYGNPYGWKIIVYFLFLQANFIGIGFFPVSWSLVVEEWFYIFLPIATFFFFKKGIVPKKYLLYILTLIIVIFLTRYAWNYFEKGSIIYQFDCLLIGVLLALIKLNYSKVYDRLNSWPVFMFGLSCIILLTFIYGDNYEIPLYQPFFRVTWYLLASLSIALLIPFMEQSNFFNNKVFKIKFARLFFTWTSILTYSLYLIHTEIYQINFGFSESINITIQAFTLFSFSFIIYAFYEHPMMSLRESFTLKQYIKSSKEVISDLSK